MIKPVIASWYDLTKIHTKVLMKWRDKCYACGNKYDPYNDGAGPFIHLSEILEELQSRPHVPNKQESKRIRQLKAKRK